MSRERSVRHFSLAVLVGLSLAPSSWAQSAALTTERIIDSEHGYSFRAPAGWTSQRGTGRCPAVLLTNPNAAMTMLVKPHHSDNLERYIAVESGWRQQNISLVSAISKLSDSVEYARAVGNDNGTRILVDTVFLRFSGGGGVAITNYSINQISAQQAMAFATQVFKSLEITTPAQSSQAAPEVSPRTNAGQSAASDEAGFSGKRLYFENSRSGAQFIIEFCSSGMYTETYQGMYSSGTAGDETRGRWGLRRDGGQLQLIMQTGDETKVLAVTRGSTTDSIRLDDTEYTVSESRECN